MLQWNITDKTHTQPSKMVLYPKTVIQYEASDLETWPWLYGDQHGHVLVILGLCNEPYRGIGCLSALVPPHVGMSAKICLQSWLDLKELSWDSCQLYIAGDKWIFILTITFD